MKDLIISAKFGDLERLALLGAEFVGATLLAVLAAVIVFKLLTV